MALGPATGNELGMATITSIKFVIYHHDDPKFRTPKSLALEYCRI